MYAGALNYMASRYCILLVNSCATNSRHTRLKTMNLCFTSNFNIKIAVSHRTYFYLKFIVGAAINQ